MKQKWAIHPVNATKTTEVPLIGLTLRSIQLPHRVFHSGHILPLTLCCCNPPSHIHPSPTTSKKTPHILPKMLSCMFTFPFNQEDILVCSSVERLATSDRICGQVIKVTSFLTSPPLQDLFPPRASTLLCSHPRENYECML